MEKSSKLRETESLKMACGDSRQRIKRAEHRSANVDGKIVYVVSDSGSSGSSSSDSRCSSFSTNPSSYDCSGKRRIKISSNVTDEKRNPDTKSVSADPSVVASKLSSDITEIFCKRKLSSFSPPSTNRSSYECSRKRKNVISSNVSDKKRRPAAKSVFSDPHDTANKTSSNLSEGEVKRLFKIANISSADYEFLVPLKDQRANNPPEGYISVYPKQIDAGLRFPLHDLVEKVCNYINVSPSQLVPHAHSTIVGFILFAKFYGIPQTTDCFLSLLKVSKLGAPHNCFFKFLPRTNWPYLCDKPSYQFWREEFFFLRSKGKSWNCLAKWSETYSKILYPATFAKLAIDKRILGHGFRFDKLMCKEILVHGGIEPGIPSPEFTFRYLMHNATVPKFELLPEDLPPATEAKTPSTRSTSNIPVKSTVGASFLSQLSARQPVNRDQPLSSRTRTKIPYSADMHIRKDSPASSDDSIPPISRRKKEGKSKESPAQQSAKKPVNKDRPLSSPSHAKIPYSTDMHIRKDSPASSDDNIPLIGHVCEEKEVRPTKSALPMSDETFYNSLPPHLLTVLQTIESAYVPRELYRKLEKDAQELTSELASTKSLVQELKEKLEFSEAKRAESKTMTSMAIEVLKNIGKGEKKSEV